MQGLRSRILTLVLTVFVGLALASGAYAHRLATQAELMLQAAGLPASALCGHPAEKPACPDDECPACLSLVALPFPAPVLKGPALVPLAVVTWLASGQGPVVRPVALGHYAQGPPTSLKG